MTNEQVSKLENLGVDLEETLERFVGNEALYFKCLNKLADDVNFAKMLEGIEGKNSSQAFDGAHALKGVSANLGLNKLYEEMKIITEVFRAGSLSYDENNMSNIKEFYNEALDTISSL